MMLRTRLNCLSNSVPNVILCRECHNNSSDNSNKKKGSQKVHPEEPTTCCMSGCPNCVWLEYADKLQEFYKDGGEEAIKQINERVTDPNMKAFLLHELRMKKKK